MSSPTQLTLDGVPADAAGPHDHGHSDRATRGRRGVFYANKQCREAWEQAAAVASESGHDEHELWTQACSLALEHLGQLHTVDAVVTAPVDLAVEKILVAFPGSSVEPIAERGMCSCPELHGQHHRAHPATGRTTCHRCYPPLREGRSK